MRLMDTLRKPAGMFSANWAGLLALLTLFAAVPGLAGVLRVVDNLDERSDDAFTTVWRHVRGTWRRDLPVSLGLLAYLAMLAGTIALIVGVYEGAMRVFFVGLGVPVYWVVGSLFGAWIRIAAAMPDESRGRVLDETVVLVANHPLRTLAGAPLFLACAPFWLIPPLTIAVGVTMPSWMFSRHWAPAMVDEQDEPADPVPEPVELHPAQYETALRGAPAWRPQRH